ncbi:MULTISPECIES: ABC transporter permease [Metallosphaera]|uniref:ABC transporter permease n=1 Tax=Metallosphaera TaxID=41980 RepID=UPI001F05B928|nr:ABC transporter permease [Metallosphaera sedula]MCH1771568.1 ABC transporter permease [Metallosphaera sedula]MCP6728639.1 ABC transporter permease [Metallosphaera sedula]
MGLAKLIGKRVAGALLVIFGELILVFFLVNVAAPNPASIWAGPEASPEQIQIITELYHLNSPWYVQFIYYIKNFFTGNWGISPLYQTPVIQLVEEYLPVTLELAVISLVLKLIIEIPLGVLSGLKPNGLLDNAIRMIYTITRSVPPFFVALGLLLVLAYDVHVFPASYPVDPILALKEPKFEIYDPFNGKYYPFWLLDNMPILNALLVGDFSAFASALDHAILPALSLTLFGFGGITRLSRNSMIEALNMDYIKTARAKGLKERVIIFRHALRNSLLPTITLSSVIFAGSIQGALVVETIFNYYGMGYYLAQSLLDLDTPSLLAGTVVVTIVVVISNLVADVLYSVVDPRVRETT